MANKPTRVERWLMIVFGSAAATLLGNLGVDALDRSANEIKIEDTRGPIVPLIIDSRGQFIVCKGADRPGHVSIAVSRREDGVGGRGPSAGINIFEDGECDWQYTKSDDNLSEPVEPYIAFARDNNNGSIAFQPIVSFDLDR